LYPNGINLFLARKVLNDTKTVEKVIIRIIVTATSFGCPIKNSTICRLKIQTRIYPVITNASARNIILFINGILFSRDIFGNTA
jgi:hypothetical protein